MPHRAHHAVRRPLSSYQRVLNLLILILAVVEPLFTLPQTYNVWILHDTAGVSLTTWSFFTLASAVWTLYGLAIKNRPLIIASTLWTLLQGLLVAGLLVVH